MVLFVNVNLNQVVEVKRGRDIVIGVVKCKGPLATLAGDWVGVALNEKIGNHNGMYKGRRYFQCKEGHGIFTRANNIRFISKTRCLYDKYHTVSRASYVDETLFGRSSTPEVASPYGPVSVSDRYRNTAQNLFSDKKSMFEKPKAFHLSHSIGRSIPASTMRPQSAMAAFCYTSTPVHDCYYDDEEAFIRSPTIPKTHMPYMALKRQVKRGWENTHYVREMSVPSGRDSIKQSQWNDVSL